MLNELITASLMTGATSEILTIESRLLSTVEKKWVQFIRDYSIKFGVAPSLSRFENEFSSTFVAVPTPDPLADVAEQALTALRNRFTREYITKHQDMLKNGDDPTLIIRELFDVVMRDSLGCTALSAFDNQAYFEVSDLLPTGLPTIDALTGGFAKGDLGFIVGRLGDGKTSMLRHLIAKWYLAGKRILLISNEIRWDEMLWQVDCILANLPPGEKRSGKWSETTKQKLRFLRHFASIHDGEIVIPRRTVRNPAELHGLIAEHRPDVVAIDGAYLMSGDGKATSEWQQLAAVSRELKQIANNLNVAVVGVIQANRGAELQVKMTSSSIAGTDSFGQDADIVWSVRFQKTEGMRRYVKASTVKNRHGMMGDCTLCFDYGDMSLYEVEDDDDA